MCGLHKCIRVVCSLSQDSGGKLNLWETKLVLRKLASAKGLGSREGNWINIFLSTILIINPKYSFLIVEQTGSKLGLGSDWFPIGVWCVRWTRARPASSKQSGDRPSVPPPPPHSHSCLVGLCPLQQLFRAAVSLQKADEGS